MSRQADFASSPYFERVARAIELLGDLSSDFDPETDASYPAWVEISSWGAEAVEAILGAAWSEETLLAAAINVLGWRKDRHAFLPLADMLEELDEASFADRLEWAFIASALIEALGRIGDERIIEVLNRFLARLLGLGIQELNRQNPGRAVLELLERGIAVTDDGLVYYTLTDVYEELGASAALPMTAMLAILDEVLRNQILDYLKGQQCMNVRSAVAVLAAQGVKKAKVLLDRWDNERMKEGDQS